MKEKICIYCSANNFENATKDIFDEEMCIIFICSDRTFIPHQVGFQQIQPSSMTNEAVIRNGAEKVIDLHGHIVGIAISSDYKALHYFCSKDETHNFEGIDYFN